MKANLVGTIGEGVHSLAMDLLTSHSYYVEGGFLLKNHYLYLDMTYILRYFPPFPYCQLSSSNTIRLVQCASLEYVSVHQLSG